MPRTTETVTLSLPTADRRLLERAHKQERRSRSAVMREALHEYVASRRPPEKITAAEIAEIRISREQIARGEYITLDELNEKLASSNSKANRKENRKTARR